MGTVQFGPPEDIVDLLRRSFHLTTFVETGTYQGATAAWASASFDKVITIEAAQQFHEIAQDQHRNKPNIQFLHGNSRAILRDVVAHLTSPALFWLDAHWMPGAFGAGAECPTIDEIAVILESAFDHFILVDDARLFLAPPPKPHKASDWPDISEIILALNVAPNQKRYAAVHRDVIISVPEMAAAVLRDFLQGETTSEMVAQTASARPILRQKLSALSNRILRKTPG
ncbi:MAG: hypothetical protein ACR2ID_07625 [Chthoniobacterales bacterium]